MSVALTYWIGTIIYSPFSVHNYPCDFAPLVIKKKHDETKAVLTHLIAQQMASKR